MKVMVLLINSGIISLDITIHEFGNLQFANAWITCVCGLLKKVLFIDIFSFYKQITKNKQP